MNLIKVKQLDFALKYLNKNQLKQDTKIVWSYNGHLLTFDSFKYQDNTYPVLNNHLGKMTTKAEFSYLDNESDDIFSLIRDKIIHELLGGFDITRYLKDDHLILLNTLVDLVNQSHPSDKEISKVQIDAIYNVNYLDVPALNLDFMKLDSNSEFEPVSIISVSNN